MDVHANVHPKMSDYLQVVVSPGGDDIDIEVWAYFVSHETSVSDAIDDVARALCRCGDEFEECRWEADPTTGAPGPVDRMAVVRKIELLVERYLPAGVEVDDIG